MIITQNNTAVIHMHVMEIRMSGTRNLFVLVERKNMLIKDNISRDIHPTRFSIKTFIPFMQGAIAEKYTFFGMKKKFVFVVSTQMRPTSTSKHSHHEIIWWCMKKMLYRAGVVKDSE
jgi:hypothetical protein